jgi:hypothetical protein
MVLSTTPFHTTYKKRRELLFIIREAIKDSKEMEEYQGEAPVYFRRSTPPRTRMGSPFLSAPRYPMGRS